MIFTIDKFDMFNFIFNYYLIIRLTLQCQTLHFDCKGKMLCNQNASFDTFYYL